MLVSSSWRTGRLACQPVAARVLRTYAKPISRRAHLAVSHTTSQRCVRSITTKFASGDLQDASKEVQERISELAGFRQDLYPRLRAEDEQRQSIKSVHDFLDGTRNAEPEESSAAQEQAKEARVFQVGGRITAVRHSGKKLTFIDITEDDSTCQIMLQYNALKTSPDETDFGRLVHLLRRGDSISVRGRPYRARDGTASIKAVELPQLTAPCLQRFPVIQRGLSKESATGDSHSLESHVLMLTDPTTLSTLRIRSEILRRFRAFFNSRQFLEVETPILAGLAGGATARPFLTGATEFPNRKLSLRVAPELWLKRLIIGGMARVYEIGPCFRNEGLDKTHNPEFTTCEFYARYNLSQLMTTTEDLMTAITAPFESMDEHDVDMEVLGMLKSGPYSTLDFIPSINAALGIDLPNLNSESARDNLAALFISKEIPLPDAPTLPRLLDALASHYLEPQCTLPTWITYHPECLSPLSKSFIHPTASNNQPVAARAELFIKNKEIVNCYEEENDPFKQRRKFIQQQQLARDSSSGRQIDDEAMKIDEDYIRALEWGLPPTGGWGCGIDRLTMLYTGRERIGDVRAFGNLRAVTRGAAKEDTQKATEPAGD